MQGRRFSFQLAYENNYWDDEMDRDVAKEEIIAQIEPKGSTDKLT